jgi:hypothetical protein
MSRIIISDPVKLREAIEFATKNGCLDQLGRDVLRLLHTLTVGMTKENNRTAELGYDFAPLSMSFAIWDGERSRENLVFNGGWIYSGPGTPADGSFPSLSVNLVSNGPVHRWSVHT